MRVDVCKLREAALWMKKSEPFQQPLELKI